MANASISVAEIFVAQSHLAVDDPEGSATMGAPEQVVAWASGHVLAASTREWSDRAPTHSLIEFHDGSAVAVVRRASSVRVANQSEVRARSDWGSEHHAWVQIGGQPLAGRYERALDTLIANAPHPAAVIAQPERGQDTRAG